MPLMLSLTYAIIIFAAITAIIAIDTLIFHIFDIDAIFYFDYYYYIIAMAVQDLIDRHY